jgi:hypothetical protein
MLPQLLGGNCTFVIGYDTCLRLLQSKYYSDSSVHAALSRLQARLDVHRFAATASVRVTHLIQAAGCSFKVAGRVAAAFSTASGAEQSGFDAHPHRFLRLEHLRQLIPAFASELFSEISERDCRVDVSSSQLRAAAAAAASAAGPGKL